MTRHKIIHENFESISYNIDSLVANFGTEGKIFTNQNRNTLKYFDLNGFLVNIKSFKTPNIINQISYNFFRKSKAQRSFEYANTLMTLGFGTPQPMAYYEYKTTLFFKKSFYVSEHLNCDLTYRTLTKNLNFPNHEDILRAFTRFTFDLHEKQVHFLDHSSGNTLIKITKTGYQFYLVDLNRMAFEPLDFETRMKNFARLTNIKALVEIMSDEYAKCLNVHYHKVFELMWGETLKFQKRFQRRRRLKKKLKFWKRY